MPPPPTPRRVGPEDCHQLVLRLEMGMESGFQVHPDALLGPSLQRVMLEVWARLKLSGSTQTGVVSAPPPETEMGLWCGIVRLLSTSLQWG